MAVAGLILGPYAVLSLSGSQLARAVARRGPHDLLPTGSVVFASAMLRLAVAHEHLWQGLIVMAIGGLGSGFTFSSLPMPIVPMFRRRRPVARWGSTSCSATWGSPSDQR